jgi:hypothetical protein
MADAQRSRLPGDRRLDRSTIVDLYDWLDPPIRRRVHRTRKDRNQTDWTVTDDWPEDIPVTEAELDVFEAWFGELFEELFGES